MGLFTINTKSAVTTVGVFTTGATVGTFTQLPNVVCDDVDLSVTTGTAVAAQVSNSASPTAGAFLVLPTGVTMRVKTGGNLSNLWLGPSTAVAARIGYMTIQYLPIT